MKYLLMFLTLVIGGLMPAQALLNARLGKQIGGPMMGALMSFFVGGVMLLVLNMIINGQAIQQLRPLQTSPWYLWLGGVMGALFVGYITWVNQQQGVALTFALVVSGQIFASLLIDHYGLLGATIRTITWEKMAGVVLIMAGVLLIKK